MPSTITLHRVLSTTPEKLYRAFLEPDALAKWLPPDGFTCTVHSLEPQEDGSFRMSFRNFTIGDSHSFGGDYIASAGFPVPLLLAWLAAIFEIGLALAFLTGAFFSEAALAAGVYVIFLAFAFHGPAHWEANQAEFGFFVEHFTFLAGLLFAAVHGPGWALALRWQLRPWSGAAQSA